jgi:hypothetical protein
VRIPSFREARGEAFRARDVAPLFEKAPDHAGELAHLHVLEAQFPEEPVGVRFSFDGAESPFGSGLEEVFLLDVRVGPERLVELRGRARGLVGETGEESRQQPAEPVVEAPVVVRQDAGQTIGVHVPDSFTCSREESGRECRMRLRASVLAPPFLVAVAFAVASACAPKGDPVRATLDGMTRAAHDRDAERLMEFVAPNFQAENGSGRQDADALVRRYFAAYEMLDVSLSDVQIERGENAARARFRAKLSGQPRRVGGLEGLVPSSSSYDFDVRLAQEGGRWKVAWASWTPAEGR